MRVSIKGWFLTVQTFQMAGAGGSLTRARPSPRVGIRVDEPVACAKRPGLGSPTSPAPLPRAPRPIVRTTPGASPVALVTASRPRRQARIRQVGRTVLSITYAVRTPGRQPGEHVAVARGQRTGLRARAAATARPRRFRAPPIRVARVGPVGRIKAKGPVPSAPASAPGRAPRLPTEVLKPGHARVGVGSARASVRSRPLACRMALARALRPRKRGVVLVGPRLTTWAAPILAAAASRKRLLAPPVAWALRVPIRRNKRPIPERPPSKRDGAAKAPRLLLLGVPLVVGTPVVGEIATLGVGPPTATAPPA